MPGRGGAGVGVQAEVWSFSSSPHKAGLGRLPSPSALGGRGWDEGPRGGGSWSWGRVRTLRAVTQGSDHPRRDSQRLGQGGPCAGVVRPERYDLPRDGRPPFSRGGSGQSKLVASCLQAGRGRREQRRVSSRLSPTAGAQTGEKVSEVTGNWWAQETKGVRTGGKTRTRSSWRGGFSPNRYSETENKMCFCSKPSEQSPEPS